MGTAATFNNIHGVAVDASGIAYIGDQGNNRVRRIVMSSGAVTTLAGSGASTSTDGVGTAATFYRPTYVALDGLGNLYVTDFLTHLIRKVVLATWAVTTVAGTGVGGAANGVGIAASFNKPRGIACDANGNAYVTVIDHRIRMIVLSSMTVTTLAGTGAISAANGVGTNAGFSSPFSVAVDSSGTLLFVADSGNNMIRQIVIATQTVTTLAGNGTAGAANGVGVAAQFNNPYGLAVDSNGNLFVCDFGSYLIRQIVIATKTVTTIAGSGVSSSINGFGTNAAFAKPSGLAMDARGNLLLADQAFRVRLLQPTVPCPAGVYCAPGTEAVECTPGYFCAAGADRVPCNAGYFCPSGSSAQVPCPAGAFYCAAGASAPVSIACAAGYVSDLTRPYLCLHEEVNVSGCFIIIGVLYLVRICRQGLALGTTTCANCTPGFYCAAGSLNVFGGTNITSADFIFA